MDQHFDAERLAAFADGTLSAAERAAAEAHAADCAQCLQLLAAMARTHEDPPPSPGAWRLPVFVRWAAPLAAAATGVALWVYVLGEPRTEPNAPELARVATEQEKVSTPSTGDEALAKSRVQELPQAAEVRKPDEKVGQRAAATNERKESLPARAAGDSRDAFYREDKRAQAAQPDSAFSARREAAKRKLEPSPASPQAMEENLRVATAAPSTPPPSPPSPSPPSPSPPLPPAAASAPAVAGAKPASSPTPSSVAETVATDRAAVDKLAGAVALRQRSGAAAVIEASAPDRRFRWRVTDVVVERSTDGGATWVTIPAAPRAPVLAIACPSANVAWFVGRAGTVFVFSDGTWTRATFPESVDLTAVSAVNSREAQVTTLDGRTFHTADGGRTWSVQETPAPAF
jgi:hypothetical protein